eukprot:4109065-Amphidinium_carterae.1
MACSGCCIRGTRMTRRALPSMRPLHTSVLSNMRCFDALYSFGDVVYLSQHLRMLTLRAPPKKGSNKTVIDSHAAPTVTLSPDEKDSPPHHRPGRCASRGLVADLHTRKQINNATAQPNVAHGLAHCMLNCILTTY